VKAAEILNNGGFESGLSGWSTANALGGDGSFFLQSGTLSPVNGDAVPAPPGGSNAAMSDGQGPGTHVLYQDFIVPGVSLYAISFDLFIGNRADLFATPANRTLDFGINAPNQQVRVDLMIGSSDPFSVAASDVLLNLYQSAAGDALVSGYTTRTSDLSALLNARVGQTLRIRFAETDNLAELQAGVDNVSLTATPEPGSALLIATGCVFALIAKRKLLNL